MTFPAFLMEGSGQNNRNETGDHRMGGCQSRFPDERGGIPFKLFLLVGTLAGIREANYRLPAAGFQAIPQLILQ